MLRTCVEIDWISPKNLITFPWHNLYPSFHIIARLHILANVIQFGLLIFQVVIVGEIRPTHFPHLHNYLNLHNSGKATGCMYIVCA